MNRNSWLLLVAGLLVSLLPFGLSFDNSFRDDDYTFLAHVTGSQSVPELLQPSPTDFAFFRPGALLLFRLEYGLFGLHGGWFLAFNYALHVAASLLLVWILLALGTRGEAAALAASLFAIGFCHYAKQVMWACTSGPLFSVVLVLLALGLAIRLARDPGAAGFGGARRRTVTVAAIALLLALAPLFHEASVIGPALLVLSVWGADPRRIRDRLSALGMVCVPVLAWVGWLLAMPQFHVYHDPEQRILQAPITLFRYLGFMLVPIQESQLEVASRVQTVVAAGVVAASGLIFWRGTRTARLLCAWIGLGLAPFCLIPLPDRWLEPRYLYCAALPACALAAMLVVRLYESQRGMSRALIAALVVAVVTGTLAVDVRFEAGGDRLGSQPESLQKLHDLRARIAVQESARSSCEPSTTQAALGSATATAN